ncbi:hypothetical protein HFP72_00750 [Nocardiopsis sp. ARC36]
MLSRLAVHADGCDLDTAEEVCSDGEGVPRARVLDLVGSLVDRSLVVAADRPGGTRYHLLESVAAYALERLEEAGEAGRTRARHAAHFADLAERADALLRGPEQGHWLERLDRESANLRAALEFAVGEGDAHLAARLANALCWYRYLRGRTGEARDALDAALCAGAGPAAGAPSPDRTLRGGEARARAVVWRTALSAPGSEDDRSRRAAADEDLAGVGDPAERARLAWFSELTRWGLGDLDRATRRTEEALAASLEAGDPWCAAVCRVGLARTAFVQGSRRRRCAWPRRANASCAGWGTGGASSTPPTSSPRRRRRSGTSGTPPPGTPRGCGSPRSCACGARSPSSWPAWGGSPSWRRPGPRRHPALPGAARGAGALRRGGRAVRRRGDRADRPPPGRPGPGGAVAAPPPGVEPARGRADRDRLHPHPAGVRRRAAR